MGVQYLTRYAKEQPNIFCQINISDEIVKWRNVHGNAVIIFDVMGFVHNFGHTTNELTLGGRHHIYLRNFEQFIVKLIQAGANLAFFCDGQLQSSKNDEWCRRRNTEYRDALSLILPNNNNDAPSKRRFGCKSIVKSLLKLVEDKRYGEIVISTHVDCDKAIAKYAAVTGALAVIASDSDFLIFDGNFQWWEANSVHMQTMQAKCFKRNQLHELLNLTSEQMKYFATIAGNDYTKHLIKKRQHFDEIANFCQTLCSTEYVERIYQDIVRYMRIEWQSIQEANNCIAESIKSYDINFDVPDPVSTRMDMYCASNVLLYAFSNHKVFQYEVNFLDFNQCNQINQKTNNFSTFVDVLLEVFRKLGGILLKGTVNPNAMLKIVTKYSMNERYTLREYVPIYPKGHIDIEQIIFGESNQMYETKWNLLLWSLGLDQQIRFDLERIPQKYMLTVLALIFLCKTHEITTLMADALLFAQYNIIEMNIKLDAIGTHETHINEDTVRVGQLFNRTITLLWDCFMVCGLKRFIQLDWYDGPYFSKLVKRFQSSETFYNGSVRRIHKYRLYATENRAI